MRPSKPAVDVAATPENDAPPPVPASAGSTVPAGPNPAAAGFRASAMLRQQLSQSIPRLWAKACEKTQDNREQHRRLQDLIVWYLKKNGCDVIAPWAQSYFDHGRTVQGRLDVMAVRAFDGVRLAVEASFKASSGAGYKLLSAKRDGAAALLVCGFAADATAAHLAMTRACGKPTGHWFHVTCLPAITNPTEGAPDR